MPQKISLDAGRLQVYPQDTRRQTHSLPLHIAKGLEIIESLSIDHSLRLLQHFESSQFSQAHLNNMILDF